MKNFRFEIGTLLMQRVINRHNRLVKNHLFFIKNAALKTFTSCWVFKLNMKFLKQKKYYNGRISGSQCGIESKNIENRFYYLMEFFLFKKG